MKVKEEIKGTQEFKPVTIELVIESEQELCDLYYRMNLSYGSVHENDCTRLKHPPLPAGNAFFDSLTTLINRFGLK